jgi:two-component system nitrate/nitrite response regulator NarL
MLNIIIADDHVLFIDGLKALLREEPDLIITDIANDGKELLDILRYRLADIVLLDINMPKINGLEATRLVKQSYPSIKILIVSTYNDEHLIERAKQLDASGFLLKNSSKEELLLAIRQVAKGDLIFPSRLAKTDNEFDQKDTFLKQFNLSKREKEIVQLIRKNLTNQQIASELFLSVYTVETHRKNIMQKIGIKSPTALMKFIIENDL